MTRTRVTYLVGTHRRFRQYSQQCAVPEGDHGVFIMPVAFVSELPTKFKPEQSVIFLKGWQELSEWRAIYNACLARGLAQPWNRTSP